MRAGLLARHLDARLDGFLIREMVSGLDTSSAPAPIRSMARSWCRPRRRHGRGPQGHPIALLPVEEAEVRAMLTSLRSAPLLGAFRGRPPRDVDALVGRWLACRGSFSIIAMWSATSRSIRS